MSCKYNNSMYTTTPPEMVEYFDGEEVYPIEEVDYAALEKELLKEGWI